MGAAPKMNRSAKGEARSSLHYGDEGVLIHSSHQGVCGRHGTEEQRVTSGGLAQFVGGTAISEPISEMRKGERRCVSSRTAEWYLKCGESRMTSGRQAEWLAGRRRAMAVGARQRDRELRRLRWRVP